MADKAITALEDAPSPLVGDWYLPVAQVGLRSRRILTTDFTAGLTVAWASISGTPTTLAGYGITDALLATSYTAADVLVKLLTVDGAASALDADLLDGQHGAYYADIPARLGYTPLNATSYTAADVLAKLLTVDGAGSGLDADTLDGQSSAAFQPALALTALNYTRVNTGGTAYELRTPAQVSTDVTFVRSETGADARTLQDKLRDVVDAADFGVTYSGSDESTAVQEAVTAVVNAGGALYFRGPCKFTGITINAANGGAILGNPGVTIFKPVANSNVMFTITGSVSTKPLGFYGIGFDGDTRTGVTGILIDDPYSITLRDIWVKDCDTVFHARVQAVTGGQGHGITIDGVRQWGRGCWKFIAGTDKRIYEIIIDNFNHFAQGSPGTWTAPLFTFRRVAGALISNYIGQSLDGQVDAIQVLGAAEGVFVVDSIIVYPKNGIVCDADSDTAAPAYVYLSSVAIDQPTEAGASFANTTFIKCLSCNVTNGAIRSNTGAGVALLDGCADVQLIGCSIKNNDLSGLTIAATVVRTIISDCLITNNAVSGGFDLNAAFFSPEDPSVNNCVIGSRSVTGGLMNGPGRSPILFDSISQAGTPANTTETTLKSYSLPADTLAFGITRMLRITAFGNFAANGNTKTLRLKFGATQLAAISVASSGTAWGFDAVVTLQGAAAQYARTLTRDGTTGNALMVVATETLSGAVSIVLTGQNGTASANDILVYAMTVELV